MVIYIQPTAKYHHYKCDTLPFGTWGHQQYGEKDTELTEMMDDHKTLGRESLYIYIYIDCQWASVDIGKDFLQL